MGSSVLQCLFVHELPNANEMTQITPFEPGALSVDGLSTNPANKLGATTDIDAIGVFLKAKGVRSKHTVRRYRREVMRFYAWLRSEVRKPLAAVTLPDLFAYEAFIKNPPLNWSPELPELHESDREWMPFPNPIPPGQGVDQVFVVIKALFGFLSRSGYITGNPTAAFPVQGKKAAPGTASKYKWFPREEWELIVAAIETLPRRTKRDQLNYERIRYLVRLLYGTAMRTVEVVGHTHSAFRKTDAGWQLTITGKGLVERTIPVNEGLIEDVMRYRRFHGITSLPGPNDQFPMCGPLEPVKNGVFLGNVIERQALKMFSAFLEHATAEIEDTNLAESIMGKGLHGIRHTALTHLAERMPIQRLQQFAGHRDIKTTAQYYHTEIHEMHDAVRDFGL